MKLALESLGFSKQQATDLFSVIAGILHLSNVGFADATIDGGEGSKAKDMAKCSSFVVSLLHLVSSLCKWHLLQHVARRYMGGRRRAVSTSFDSDSHISCLSV